MHSERTTATLVTYTIGETYQAVANLQESLSSTTKNVQEFFLRQCAGGRDTIVAWVIMSRNRFASSLQLALWLKLPLRTPVRRRRLLRRGGVLLLPPVLGAVHVDLLLPALVAAERRVPSSHKEHEINTIIHVDLPLWYV
jgi:hypothetical protein